MSWQGQLSTIVRYLINDIDPQSYKYSNQRIETAILVAAQIISLDIDLPNSYTINVEQCSLSPDPTDTDTRDNVFINLVSLKTACIIVGSEVKTEAANSISIRDGVSSIDMRGVSSTLMLLYKDLCGKYDKMLEDYGYGSSLGQAILGPYSPGSDYITRTHSDQDFRGNYFRY